MKRLALCLLLLPAILTRAAAAQGGSSCRNPLGWDGQYFHPPLFAGNPVYDGHITFARIRYSGDFECGNEGPGWSHDYPITEAHFVNIMQTISTIHPFIRQGEIEASALITFDDSTLFKYPVAYLSEPGGWNMNAAELKGFKQYINRGGFIIFDDMGWRGRNDMPKLLQTWHTAFPNAVPIALKPDHPIFNAFFAVDLNKISSYVYPDGRGQYGSGGANGAQYLAIFEDNDPKKRMLAVINNNQDLGEYMEFSDRGLNPLPSTEAYKLAVNYFIYALTH